MSRSWKEYEYLDAQNFWCKIDELGNAIDLKVESNIAQQSECYRMYLAGQRDMLDKIIDYLSDNEQRLEDIAERQCLPINDKE